MKEQASRKKESLLRDYLQQYMTYENTLNYIQSQIDSLRLSYTEALAAKSLLGSFEEIKDRDFLSGMGSGIFLVSKLSDKSKVMVSLGKDVVAKLTVKEAIEYLDNKIKMLDEAISALQTRLNEIAQEMLRLKSKIEALYRTVQG